MRRRRGAVAKARAAQPAWARLSYRERARFILRAREIVLERLEEIAKLISRETGKPVTEAIAMEIVPTLDLMQLLRRLHKADPQTQTSRSRPVHT
jgi:acyl-CoA reductase-like NAD-dependent aldehyde dehydrogenase